MSTRRSIAAAGIALALAACTSPEATRVQGGGPGADVGNRDADLRMHDGSVIYANTPCLTTLPECNGPLPLETLPRD